MLKILVILTSIVIVACAERDGDSRLKERAQIEEAERANVDKKVREERAKEMEADLLNRYRFIKAISHEYEGITQTTSKFKLRIGMLPTINIVETNRVRTLEEIASDLASLFLNAQIVMAVTPESAFGCTFINIKPDIPNGIADLIAEECPIRLTIRLSDKQNPKPADIPSMSSMLSSKILRKEIDTVNYINVKVQSINLPEPYSANLKLKVN